jgi:hypothetical protein
MFHLGKGRACLAESAWGSSQSSKARHPPQMLLLMQAWPADGRAASAPVKAAKPPKAAFRRKLRRLGRSFEIRESTLYASATMPCAGLSRLPNLGNGSPFFAKSWPKAF